MHKYIKILMITGILAVIFLVSYFVVDAGKSEKNNWTLKKGFKHLTTQTGETVSLTGAWISMESEFLYWFINDHTVGKIEKTKIGWISDIHADRFKRRTVDSGTLYPKSYSEYLPKVFDDLRKQGITTVLANGDNTNSGDEFYAREMVKIAHRKNMQMLWVKGNHDSDLAMNSLGMKGNNFYYFKDFENTRLIVLDNTQEGIKGDWMNGGISQEQEAWLIEALKTDKKIILSMHIPIFPVTQDTIVIPQYIELEKMIRESGNVKLVLTGHFHVKWNKQFNGVDYYGESALTREGEEGGYGIVDLNDMSVNNFYAR